MIKHPQQKKKKNNNGYFTRNIQQLGEDFISKKTARDIQFDYKYIFKDLAFSDPEDISNISRYFMNATFVYNLNMCAFNELSSNNAVFLGLQTYIQNMQVTGAYVDPNMRLDENMLKAQQTSAAYGIIAAHLNNILSLFNTCIDDNWLKLNIEAQLKSLSVQLSKYKRII